MIHRAKALPENVGDTAGQPFGSGLSLLIPGPGIAVDLRDQDRDMVMVGVMKEDIEGAVVIKPGQRVVHRVVGKAVSAPPGASGTELRRTRPVLLQEDLELRRGKGP